MPDEGIRMPKMNPYDYYVNFVEQNLEEWQKDRGSISKAFNVAVPAFHLTDNYFRYYHRYDKNFSKRFTKLNDFQTELSRRAKYFRTIQSMATAYKHLYTNVKCEVASGGAIETVTIGNQTIGLHYQELNGHIASYIEIRRRDGSVVRFDTAIEEVVGMWRKIICSSDNQPSL